MKPHYFDTNKVDGDDERHFEAIRRDEVALGCMLGGVMIQGLAELAPQDHGRADVCAVCPASAEWRRICQGRPQKVTTALDTVTVVDNSRNNTAEAYRLHHNQQIAAIYKALGLKPEKKT